jgi:hypothetical protein
MLGLRRAEAQSLAVPLECRPVNRLASLPPLLVDGLA